MPIKRFCSLCDREIPNHKEYYNILVEAKSGDKEEDPLETIDNEFCQSCIKKENGILKILMDIMNRRNPDPDWDKE